MHAVVDVELYVYRVRAQPGPLIPGLTCFCLAGRGGAETDPCRALYPHGEIVYCSHVGVSAGSKQGKGGEKGRGRISRGKHPRIHTSSSAHHVGETYPSRPPLLLAYQSAATTPGLTGMLARSDVGSRAGEGLALAGLLSGHLYRRPG